MGPYGHYIPDLVSGKLSRESGHYAQKVQELKKLMNMKTENKTKIYSRIMSGE